MDSTKTSDPGTAPSAATGQAATATMDHHAAEVSRISARLAHFYATRSPFRVYHGSTNSTRPSTKTRATTVDTSPLNRVLSVDAAARIAAVEPNVGMLDLARATLEHGLVPPVVMEFPGITAGGGFSGTSGESSSFRHGVFEATVQWAEIVLADGEVARVSREERPDLFWGAASAFGTLGVVTLLGINLVPARAYVRLEYHLATDLEKTVEAVRAQTARDEIDFVDGIVFARDRSIICAGRMVDDVPADKKPVRFTRAHDTWFYLRAQKHASRLANPSVAGPAVDYIPLLDYYFRYDRGAFWTARYAFKYFVTPFNRVTRAALDRLLHTRTMYAATHYSGLADFYLTQDVSVPMDAAAGFAGWLDETYGIYPLWLCPLRVAREEGAQHGIHGAFCAVDAPPVLNFGVWGPLSFDREAAVEGNRRLEKKVAALGGMKCLYAQTCYTEEEFWAVYDRESYDELREKYRASHLPSVYDKVKRDVEAEKARERKGVKGKVWKVWPVRGVYGVYRVIRGGDYLLQDVGKGSGKGSAVGGGAGAEKANGA